MIEFCTKKRMIFSILGLIILTIIILILEGAITSGLGGSHPQNTTQKGSILSSPSIKPSKNINTNPEESSEPEQIPCWYTEEFEILKSCVPCTKFEVNSKTPAACVETGFKETLKCKSSGISYRSCSTTDQKEKINFWLFETLMVVSGFVFYGLVKIRNSQLEKRTIRNIEQRLAVGH